MLKSITSKLVAISASTALAGTILASSASALTVQTKPVHLPCAPQIALTSDGQVRGTCFGATGTVWLAHWDQVPHSDGSEQVVVAADGTFTTPITNLEELRYPENELFIIGEQYPGPSYSNELEVEYSGPVTLNLQEPAL